MLYNPYGKILPTWMFGPSQFFPQGVYNIHASLLPRDRGASPIHAALMNEEHETGLSIQRMAPELDAGPVWLSAKTVVDIADTFGTLEEKLINLLPELMWEFGRKFPPAVTSLTVQSSKNVSYAPKLS